MNLINAVILAIVQGLTEFLPVSSSGHLVLGEAILGANSFGNSIAFELVVHLGTFLAVVVLFWQDIVTLSKVFFKELFSPGTWSTQYEKNEEFRFSVLLLIGMLPAGFIGLLLRDQISELFSQPLMVSMALLVTGSMLLATMFFKKSDQQLSFKHAILIGFAQALALIPGISRSGSTISIALALGIKQEQAARFSFIMVLPLIVAATIFEFMDLLQVGISQDELAVLFIGLMVSFIVGILSLKWLLALLKGGKFHYFAWYCFTIAILGIVAF